MFKPQEDGIKASPRITQDDESKEDNHSSFINSDTLPHVDNLSCNDSKSCKPWSGIFCPGYIKDQTKIKTGQFSRIEFH